MKTVIVGVADCQISSDPDVMLATYALGSCIAVSIYDRGAQIGGLLHFMLPASPGEAAKAAANPFMFADTGLKLLFQKVGEAGAQQQRALVCLAGGAQMMDPSGLFNIGKRNHTAARTLLWKTGLMVHAEAVGGKVSRSVGLEIATGRFWVRESGLIEREIYPASKSGGG